MNLEDKIKEIKKRFEDLQQNKTESEKLEHDEYMLMAAFLSEIEKIQKQKAIKRNRLAELIDISASYLTQVFGGDKPLNFHTIAKIQKALGIKFYVKAYYKNEMMNEVLDLDMPKIYMPQNFQPLYNIEELQKVQ